ncbi:hypothetical protein [Massilia sp. BHUDP2]|uniref:hypothetical protein n=1 Tax=Massilia sp. BHUDP2 TaxID=3034505 RepID=UPI0039060677
MNKMSNFELGVRALALVAVVAFSTAVLVEPELIGGSKGDTALAIGAIPALSHH